MSSSLSAPAAGASSSPPVDETDSIEHVLDSVESAREDGPESAFAALFSLIFPDHASFLAKWNYRHLSRLYRLIFNGYADWKGVPTGDGASLKMREELIQWMDTSPQAKQHMEEEQKQIDQAVANVDTSDHEEEEKKSPPPTSSLAGRPGLRSLPSRLRARLPPAAVSPPPLPRPRVVLPPPSKRNIHKIASDRKEEALDEHEQDYHEENHAAPANASFSGLNSSDRDAILASLARLPPVILPNTKAKGHVGKKHKHKHRKRRSVSPASSSSSDSDSSSSSSSSSSSTSSSASTPRALSSSHGHPERIARHVIKQMNGKFFKTFKEDVTFKSERNRKECLALAKIIDQMRKEGLRSSSLALEMAIRRLTGVQSADTSDGNWALADELDMDSGTQSFLPHRVLKHMLANTARLHALQHSKQTSQKKGSFKKKNNKYNQPSQNGSKQNKSNGAASTSNTQGSKEGSNQK